jgi:hypothetical protein
MYHLAVMMGWEEEGGLFQARIPSPGDDVVVPAPRV